MTPQEILAQLNPEQAAAASTLDGPVLVLAGAGTGKTRVITYRIAYMLAMGIPPTCILGMTFTNKAAREMRERLATLVEPAAAELVTLGTFHSFCGRLLRREIRRLGYLSNFTIADEADQTGLVKQAAGQAGLGDSLNLAAAQAQISRWKNRLFTPRMAKNDAAGRFEELAARVYEEYQDLLEMQNSVDFDDMLLLAYRVLKEYPEVAEHCRERYKYLLIDEYQDTNAAQFAIVKLLAGERRNLCVVGDDDQSIYSWRGADVGNILDFPQLFPGAKVVKLEQNYRSTNNILNAANAVIRHGERRLGKKLWSSLGDGKKPVSLTLDSGEAEADFICNMIRRDMNENPGRAYGSYAVLYRSNQLSRQLEQSFRNFGVPYRVFGGQQFYQRREIKDAVAYLKLLVNPNDDQSLLRVLAAPPRGLGAKAVELLKAARLEKHRPMLLSLGDADFVSTLTKAAAAGARELAAVCAAHRREFDAPGNLAGKIAKFLSDVGYTGALQRIYKDIEDSLKRRDNVEEFINGAAQFESRRSEPATLRDFLESFALLEDEERDEDKVKDAVTFSTVHAAKGLEFPVVFLVALEQGMFPHERAIAEGGGDEELRLFYVALTRAKQELYLLHARSRLQRGVPHPERPSPFLSLLGEDLVDDNAPEELVRPADNRRAVEAFMRIYQRLNRGAGDKKG
jgi:superfamily I DNA/RNA helicase